MKWIIRMTDDVKMICGICLLNLPPLSIVYKTWKLFYNNIIFVFGTIFNNPVNKKDFQLNSTYERRLGYLFDNLVSICTCATLCWNDRAMLLVFTYTT
jgi:hypothetical protein